MKHGRACFHVFLTDGCVSRRYPTAVAPGTHIGYRQPIDLLCMTLNASYSPILTPPIDTIFSIKLLYIESDLVYPNSLMPIKMCSDCETCGLLNHCE